MNYLLSIIILIGGFCSVFGQSEIKVLDQKTLLSVPNCRLEIEALQSGEKLVVGTNNFGSTSVNISGNCVVKTKVFGYHSIIDTLLLKGNVKLFLVPDKTVLEVLAITGQYAPESPDQSVHNVKIISKDRMNAQGAVTLKDVLSNETNMRLTQDGILGSSISMQGVSGENVKILIDGVPVIGRLDGSIDLSQINLNDIERIEIVEGPMSVNYGTSALGGTINLITKKGQKKIWELNTNTYYESVGQYNWDGGVSWQKGKHKLSVSGGRNYFDGWIEGESIELLPKEKLADINRFKTWNPKEQFFAEARYQIKIGSQTISPYVQWFNETILNRGYPREPYYEKAFDDHYSTERTNVGFQSSGKIGKNYNLKILGAKNAFERIKNSWIKDLTTLDQTLTETPGDQDTSRFSLYMSRGSISRIKDSTWLKYQLGYDVSYESAYGSRINELEQFLGDFALFGSAEIQLFKNRLVLKPGIRATYNTEYKAPLIPSFHTKYVSNKWTFRGSYAQGFRAPSLKELYFLFVDINHNIIGNTNLEAEKSHNFQLNATWKKGLKKGGLRLKIGSFYNQIYNRITLGLTSVQNQYQYLNIDEFVTQGIQTDVTLNKSSWNINIGGTYNGVFNSISNRSDEISDFSYTPEVRANGSYTFKKYNTILSLFYKYTGSVVVFVLDENGNVLTGKIEGYHTLDVSISQKFWKNRITWTIGGKNLFNVTSITSEFLSQGAHTVSGGTSLTAWGTSVFTSLKFNLSL